MLNALRLVEGFEVTLFSERTGLPWEAISAIVETQADRHLLVREGTRIKPTPQGLRFLNELLLSFVPIQRRQSPKMSGAFGLSTPS
jgi:oxygen-independent coproporphyrinogen-3 oxidase